MTTAVPLTCRDSCCIGIDTNWQELLSLIRTVHTNYLIICVQYQSDINLFLPGPALIIPNPGHQLHVGPPSSSPSRDTDIQLARTDPDSTRDRDMVWAVTMPSRQQSSLQSVCGPKPAKLTTICLALLSIWAMVVLIVHLEKKVSAVSSSLSSTEDKLKSMEDTASSYRWGHQNQD